jgi:ring-1,2-phenylacetyl-CoA epoxidase subunit PaaD
MPDIVTIWGWLDAIPDPEIPVISITDLGIVRDVEWKAGQLCVTITPTYSGCPATRAITMDIEKTLLDQGVQQVRVKHQLAPAWTTDWLTPAARARLESYGIAPPTTLGGPKRCPQCQSQDVERVSQFGSTPCKALWRCRCCQEPFDYFKCI